MVKKNSSVAVAKCIRVIRGINGALGLAPEVYASGLSIAEFRRRNQDCVILYSDGRQIRQGAAVKGISELPNPWTLAKVAAKAVATALVTVE